MKKLLRALGLVALLTLGACGGGGGNAGGSSPTGATKPVNSYWTAFYNNAGAGNINMDLRNISVGSSFILSNGSCSSEVIFKGNNFGGLFKESKYIGCAGVSYSDTVEGVYAVDGSNILSVIITEVNGSYLADGNEYIFRYR